MEAVAQDGQDGGGCNNDEGDSGVDAPKGPVAVVVELKAPDDYLVNDVPRDVETQGKGTAQLSVQVW